MIKLGAVSDYSKQTINQVCLNDNPYLLINHLDRFYLLEDKCGHFGVPLSTGRIENNEIICSEHGISFSLETGEIVNRPYENCDPVKTGRLIIENGIIYAELPVD